MESSLFSKLSVELRLYIYDLALRETRQRFLSCDLTSRPTTEIEIKHDTKQKIDHGIPSPSQIQASDVRLVSSDLIISPAELEDTTIKLRLKDAFALLQTCRRIRSEAVERFYAVNSFALELNAPFRSITAPTSRDRGVYIDYKKCLPLIKPVLKFLHFVREQCSSSGARLPPLRITLWIGEGLGWSRILYRYPEAAVDFLLRTLVSQTRVCAAEEWVVDFGLGIGVFGRGHMRLNVREGSKYLKRWIDGIERREKGYVNGMESEENISEILKRLRGWRRVLASEE